MFGMQLRRGKNLKKTDWLVNSMGKRVEFCGLNSVWTLKMIQLVLLRNR